MTTYSTEPANADASAQPESPGVEILFVRSTFPTPSLIPPVVARRRAVSDARRRTGLALVLLLLGLAVFYGIGRMQLATAQSNLAVAEAELRDAERARDQYRDVPAVYAAVRAARAELAQAMGNEIQTARLVTDLSRIIPPNVSLNSLSIVTAEGESSDATAAASEEIPIAVVNFSGEAISFNDVSAWIDTLRNDSDYGNVILTEVSRDPSTGTYTFSCSAELTDQTLSGRFVEEEQ